METVFATKYQVLAKCKVDDSQEGQAKIEIQIRCYVASSETDKCSIGENAYYNGL